jgi:uncharacterized membrane protein YgcG
MTAPREEQPPAPATTGPTVSTAPPRSRWGWSRVPAHVGPARTSTVIIAVLFAGVFALWLVVRPETATVASSGSTGGAQPTQVQQTVPATTTPAPTTATTTPARSSAPSSSAATSTGERTSSSSGGSSDTSGGTSESPTTAPLVPTTGSAPSS